MTITPADLPAEFAAVADDIAQMWIDVAEATIDRAKWSCARVNPDTGVKMLAAHLIKLDANSGTPAPSGTITSKSIGGVSVSKAVSSAASGPHGLTEYGQAYDGLKHRVDSDRRRHLPPPPQPAC